LENARGKLLLIDLDDARRASRVHLLTASGFAVNVRNDYIAAERLDHEGEFDLVILALHGHPENATDYSNQLARSKPTLPILLLTDSGVYVPRGTLSESIEAGDPGGLIREIASMLAGSTHVRELPTTTA
jgi:DNA-binding NarL/FixJ family response regulator